MNIHNPYERFFEPRTDECCGDIPIPPRMDNTPIEDSLNVVSSDGIFKAIEQAVNDLVDQIGQLPDLSTGDQSSLTSAINEVWNQLQVVRESCKDYTRVVASPLDVSESKAIFAQNTSAYTFKADGTEYTGVFDGVHTTYQYQDADIVTLHNPDNELVYRWQRPALPPVDYSFLLNKPTLNGVEIEGDKSEADYGIPTQVDVDSKYTKPAAGIPIYDAAQTFRDALVPSGGMPSDVLTQTASGVPVWQSPPTGQAALVANTNSIALSGNGANVAITADINVDADPDNCLTVSTSGVGVRRTTVVSSASVTAIEFGTNDFTFEVAVSPESGNQTILRNDGIYTAPTPTNVNYAESQTVSFTGTGGLTQLIANVKVSGVPGNILTSNADGLAAVPNLSGLVRFDQAQTMTDAEAVQAGENIGLGDVSFDFETSYNAGIAAGEA